MTRSQSMSTHISLRMLSYLVTLADTRHFGRAAEACFVSQPTLSAQIKKLEEQLGVVLIERQPRNLLLTPVGVAVVELARTMLRDVSEMENTVQAHRDPLAGSLKVGLIPTLGPYLLPHIVSALRTRLPQLKLKYLEYQTDPLLERLLRGEIDLGILALPIETDGLTVRELFTEPFRLAVHTDHPLAKKRTVSMPELSGEKFMLLEDGHCLRDQALEVCALSGVAEDQEFRATSLETLRQMVAANAGITLIPALAIDRPIVHSDVVAIPFKKTAPSRQIAAIWRSTSARVAAIKRVCETVMESVPAPS